MIQVICGCMFSGKSTELRRRMNRHLLAGARCVFITHACDTRYGAPAVTTHDGSTSQAQAVCRLADARVDGATIVGVDEAQFFPDLVEFTEAWANSGKLVIVAGLDATFQRAAFPAVAALLCRAESVTKLTAVCSWCGRDASYTVRTAATGADPLDTSDGSLVGGTEAYKAACRTCWFDASSSHARLPGLLQ